MKVKDLFVIQKGKKVEEVENNNEVNVFRYIQIEDLRNNKNIKYAKAGKSAVLVSENEILIAWDGANAGTIGYGINGLLGSTLAVLRPKCDIYTPYVARYLQSKSKYLRDQCTGATIPHIQRQSLENIEIPLPSLDEQRKIAAVLDKASALIDKRKEAITKLDMLVQAVFWDMFGDPDKGKWEIVTLDQVTNKITDGVHNKPVYTTTGIPFISVKDINKGKLNFKECKFISQEDHQKYFKRCNPEKGDILYTKVGATYGIPAIVDTEEEFSLYVSVALLKPKAEIINSIFLRESMKNIWIKRQADKSIKGIGVPDLHLKEIKSFKIILPPLDKQLIFAKKVKKIESLQSKLYKNLSELESNFKSLQQRGFKGELTIKEEIYK